MEALTKEQVAHDLGLHLEYLSLIQENAYCTIYRAAVGRRPVIIKHYKGDDPTLAQAEAEALDFYHAMAEGDPNLIASRTVKFNAEKNLLCIGFVHGERFSDMLYRSRKSPELRRRAIRVMSILGGFLRRLYDATRAPGAETAPFIFEYLDYCSRRLEGIPILGALVFRGQTASAAYLSEALRRADLAPSFVHGDFVFKNIHVAEARVGLIDFANANPRSHVLNDIYNLRLALDNMVLPRSFKVALMSALYTGLGTLSFPDIAHRFYYEYHRRRWLMLKIKSRHPRDWLQALRGLMSFARPFAPEIMAP